MTIAEHAVAIEAAIKAAHDEGFELDDGYNNSARLELNQIVDGDFVGNCVRIHVPCSFN